MVVLVPESGDAIQTRLTGRETSMFNTKSSNGCGGTVVGAFQVIGRAFQQGGGDAFQLAPDGARRAYGTPGRGPSMSTPAFAVPAGLDRQGLPLGLQLIGRPFDEETLFSLGEVVEQAAGRFTPPRWW